MKKIFRNVVAVFAAVMLVSAFASCKSNDDDDDKKQENPATPEVTTPAETTATIFSEEVVLTGWSNGKVISEDKFASAKAGDVVRFVASGDNTPDGDGNVYHSFKIAANSDWASAFKEFSDVSATVEYTLTADNITAINAGDAKGLAFYGHGVKITKIELVTK